MRSRARSRRQPDEPSLGTRTGKSRESRVVVRVRVRYFVGKARADAYPDAMAHRRAAACLVNAARLDFDAKLDLSKIADACGGASCLTRHDDSTPSPAVIATRATNHDIVITKEVPVDVHLLPPSVKLICEAGTGYNNVDLDAAKRRGIVVCNVPTYSTDAVAHLVVTHVLNFSASIVHQQRMLARGDRSNFAGPKLTHAHDEVGGKTIGLVGGTGAIGAKVADIAAALGMKTLVWSRRATTTARWEAARSLHDLLERSDYVSVHCPLNAETRHLIDAVALGKMKKTAYLINTARGGVVCEEDLVDALKKGTIAGAGLDVQETEPPPEDSPLYTLPNVILTPHIGWKRVETRQRLMDMVAENIAAFLDGKPVNVVNP